MGKELAKKPRELPALAVGWADAQIFYTLTEISYAA
jgi:hypothetical protein